MEASTLSPALSTFASNLRRGLRSGYPDLDLNGVRFDPDPAYASIAVAGLNGSPAEIWSLLKAPLARAIGRLEAGPHNPAVSYRNFHAVTATLMSGPAV